MRFPHWLKNLASSLVLTVTAGPVLAQSPGGPGGGQPMFQPAYGANDPGVLYPQGVPQGYQPYPAISPYGMGNVGFDQTFRDSNGLWFERIMNQDRQFFGSLDVTANTIAKAGDSHLGSAYIPFNEVTGGPIGFVIPTYDLGATPGTGTGGGGAAAGGSTLPLSQAVVDPRVLPYPFLIPNNGTGTFLIDNNLFPIRDLSTFSNYRSVGLEGRWGFFNEDGTGMSMGGFWTGSSTLDFTMGEDSINGIPITQTIIAALDGSLLFTQNGAIPLNWGFQSIGTGAANLGTAKYDLLFHYDVKSTAIGGDTNFFMSPIVQREAFKLRPLVGGRYMKINEQFAFRGIDSGFGYELTDSQVTGGGGGGGGGGTTQAATFRPDANTIQANYDLYEATLNNSVQTQLAGPQAGLRYDFGDGDGFRMWGQSIVGLMGNQEDYHQFGNNIGDQQGLLAFGNGLDMLAADARFESNRTITHVSPLFEQTIMAEMKILEMVPLVRRLPGIDNTVFRLGWTATVVGDVARAGESIDWRGFPQLPSIRPGRETWWTTRWTFGVEKRF